MTFQQLMHVVQHTKVEPLSVIIMLVAHLLLWCESSGSATISMSLPQAVDCGDGLVNVKDLSCLCRINVQTVFCGQI